ncbi:Myo2 class V myosin [Basidiobolus meristosporus CBS 931.73]|uniref:Myo2 class V myosin n=1 Tax=Basidiobolus meristosporus CBS 931.73 TaxID=1314790 RepID=A0A1Y1YGZ3_9FUNG|nr:Myo2 class V myosin [Basidiobolus meristosporus CBS 931.73]|eukprot:ORX97267.1 Myo2 class V myosin [Basidiobolus meristosporus CBS 931.73]
MSAHQALEVYSKNTRVWLENDKEGWIGGQILSRVVDDHTACLEIKDDAGELVTLEFSLEKLNASKLELPPLCNPPILEGIDDLTNLSYLHEPAVLIACNPFQKVSLYSQDVLQAYSGRTRGELEPHLFAISEDAYRCMLREHQNQTIVVSGESGAGKTVSAKFIMRYFASVKYIDQQAGSDLSEVEEQILATNPVLEAFGNAKTTRNDNSSRFGKYIEILFDTATNIVGARVRTYLLERSRLIYQPDIERNYHIFYQLCAGATPEEKEELKIGEHGSYHYLNQGGQGVIPGVDDREELELTRKSLSLIGISPEIQKDIFRVLAALLHLGNIKIGGSDKLGAMIDEADPSFETVTSLLQLNSGEFRKWLVKKQLVTRTESIRTNLKPSEAVAARDAVAKFIYTKLFDWLIRIINKSLCSEEISQTANSFIGVLDIYGFEHFGKNSFEQFCINYANEKLQQEFNKHVFKLEQEEYIKEQIAWNFIEFSDNQPCINLIEGKLGILALLDEESRLPSGTDGTFISKLYKQYENPENACFFKKPKFSNTAFTICHYAHDVAYESEGFLDKNKDNISEELSGVLSATAFDFLLDLLPDQIEEQPITRSSARRSIGAAIKKKTLGSSFKSSLISLMDTVNSTNVHYIRCIKPNEEKKPWHFDPQMVLSQLRACGVLETIRISCEGYPSRRTIEEFVDRYYLLLPTSQWSHQDLSQFTKSILQHTINNNDKYQLGSTKVFFRAGQLAYLEKLRSDKLSNSACTIQTRVRGFLARKHYHQLKLSTVVLQAYTRRMFAMRLLRGLREKKAATRIQRSWRMYYHRKRFLTLVKSAIKIQSLTRRLIATMEVHSLRETRASVTIQKYCRRWLAQRYFRSQVRHIVYLQACVRRIRAAAELKQLKIEARSVTHFKEQSFKLENTVVAMTQQLSVKTDQNKALNEELSKIRDQIEFWKEKCEISEQKIGELTQEIATLTDTHQNEISALKAENDLLTSKYSLLSDDLAIKEKELYSIKTEYANAKKELKVKRISRTTGDSSYESLSGSNSYDENHGGEQERSTHTSWESLSPKSPHSYNHAIIHSEPEHQRTSLNSAPEDYFNARSNRGRIQSFVSNPALSGLIDEESDAFRRQTFGPTRYSRAQSRASLSWRSSSIEGRDVRSILEGEALVNEIEILLRDSEIAIQNGPRPALTRSEILYPGHLIGLCMNQLWCYDLGLEMRRLMTRVTQVIDGLVLKADASKLENILHYWLSNTIYLLQYVVDMEQRNQAQSTQESIRYHSDYIDPAKVVSKCKETLEELIVKIYNLLMIDMKKKISKLIIPGVVESQPLMEYYIQESGFFKKIMTNARNSMIPPSVKIVIEFLEHEWELSAGYFIETTVVTRIIEELLNFVGATTFNNIIMRRNFCSWKRGTQIQANITSIQEWCARVSAGIPEIVHLEQLRQAMKLLTLLNTVQDIDVLFQACDSLNPGQIKKLSSIYAVSDYEEPLSPKVLMEIAQKSETTEKVDNLFLPTDSAIDCYGVAKLIQNMLFTPGDEYVPDWMGAQLLRRVIDSSHL